MSQWQSISQFVPILSVEILENNGEKHLQEEDNSPREKTRHGIEELLFFPFLGWGTLFSAYCLFRFFESFD